MSSLNGYKTYIVGLATLAFAIGGFLSGHIEGTQAIELISIALTGMGLKHGQQTGS